MSGAGPEIKFYRGTDSAIKQQPSANGSLYFATDTRRIYLDVDENERIPMSGATGIVYGLKTFENEDVDTFEFTLSDLDNASNLPEVDDLILNSDGCFYRVQSRDKETNSVITIKLTVAGSGGGGGDPTSGYVGGKAIKNDYYFSSSATSLKIEFTGYTTAPDAQLFAQLFIGDTTIPNKTYTINSSRDEANPISIDLYPYKSLLNVNAVTAVKVSLYDENGNRRINPISFNVSVEELSLTPSLNYLGIKKSAFQYDCIPRFDRNLRNVRAVYAVYETIHNQMALPNGVIENAITTTPGSPITCDIPLLPAGSYRIEAQLIADVPNSDEQLYSLVLSQSFIYQSKDSPTNILSVTYPDNTVTYSQYQQNVNTSYVISSNSDSINIKRIEKYKLNDTDVFTETYTQEIIQNEEVYHWTHAFKQPGFYQFIIVILNANGVETSRSESGIYTVIETSDVPSVDSNGLRLWLEADKTNQAIDYNTWKSKIKDTREDKFHECIFKDFNWTSNGWRTVDGVTSLHLDNRASLEIPVSPFPSQQGEEVDTTGCTIELDVKISNIKNKLARWLTCASINNVDGVETIRTGLIANGEIFSLNFLNTTPIHDWEENGVIESKEIAGLTARFLDNERISITYVVTSETAQGAVTMPKNMVYVYINGVLSGLVSYTADTKTTYFQDYPNYPSSFIFKSDDVDIDIYNIRYYSRAIGSSTVLQNYLATYGNFDMAAQKWRDNSITADDGTISLSKVKEKNTMPYLVLRGGHPCKKDGTLLAPSKLDLPDGSLDISGGGGKKDYRAVDAYFVDPSGKTPNIGSKTEPIRCVIYPQGTSSLDYPVKNLRIKLPTKYSLYNEISPCKVFTLKADYMDSSSCHNTGTGNALNDLQNSVGLKTPAQVLDAKKVTAIVGFPFVAFFKGASLSDPYDPTVENDNDYMYVGKYNWNLDKGEHEPFGFICNEDTNYGIVIDKDIEYYNSNTGAYLSKDEYLSELASAHAVPGFAATTDEKGKSDPEKTYYTKPILNDEYKVNSSDDFDTLIEQMPLYEYQEKRNSIQCWECLTNTSYYTRFQIPWSEEIDTPNVTIENEGQTDEKIITTYFPLWQEAFESRYPEYDNEAASDKRALAVMVNWLASTNLRTAPALDGATAKLPIAIGELPEGVIPLFPSEENELLPEFKNGVYTNSYGYLYDCADYRKEKFKNEFKDHFNLDYCLFYYVLTDTLLMIDSRAKNMMLCCFDADCDAGTGHWFPIFYDMDTMLGVDNEGKMRFRYDEEGNYAGVYNASSGYSDENGEINNIYSVLWANLSLMFSDEIASYYGKLRSGRLNYDNLIKIYNTDLADFWNETYINEDAYYKYIKPLTGNGKAARLYAAQGTRSFHRARFIRDRLAYLDSKYNYMDGHNQLIMRQWVPKVELQDDYPDRNKYIVSADKSLYFKYSFTKGSYKGPILIKENQSYTTPENIRADANEQEGYMWFVDNLSSPGNFADKFLSNISFAEMDNAAPIVWRDLILSTGQPEYLTAAIAGKTKLSDLNLISSLPFLEKLVISYVDCAVQTLDLRNCKYLNQLEAFGTESITSINFPEGGVLETVQLPPKIGTIQLQGQNFLYNLEFENKESTLSRLTQLQVYQCNNLDTKDLCYNINENICSISLRDVNWEFDLDECEVENNTIVAIPLLDKIVRMNGIDSGDVAFDNNHELMLDRTYFGGNIKINNGADIGVDEVVLYNKYEQYYPNIKFARDDSEYNVFAYTFEAQSFSGAPIKTLKFGSTDLDTEFTLENIFEEDNIIKLPPQIQTPDTQFEYTFKGWSRDPAALLFKEEKASTISAGVTKEEAENAAHAALIIEYENGHYNVVNDFDFNNVYSEENKKFIIYPVFVAALRKYTISFYDEAENGGALLKQSEVKYGYSPREANALPDAIPQKIVIDENNLENIFAYPFLEYRTLSNMDVDFKVNNNLNYYAKYSTQSVNGRTLPSDDNYFIMNGTTALLKKDYNLEVVIVPTKINNITVNSFSIQNDSEACPNLKYIYFQPDNELTSFYSANPNSSSIIPLAHRDQLKYVDFKLLTNLEIIPNSYFEGTSLEVVDLSNNTAMTSLLAQTFLNCNKLTSVKLPQHCHTISARCFNKSTPSSVNDNIMTFDLVNSSVKTIQSSAFANKRIKLVNDALPQTLETIGDSAFSSCDSALLSCKISYATTPKLITIGSNAFLSHTRVIVGDFPTTLTGIGNGCFQNSIAGGGSLQFTTIPSTILNIGSNAFMFNKFEGIALKIQSANTPNLDAAAFANITNLSKITGPAARSAEAIATNCWGAGANAEYIVEG